MSQKNVEVVRRAIQAFNDRDFSAMESIYSEHVMFTLIGGFGDLAGAQFRDQDAALDWMRDWIETIGPRAQIESIRQINDRVFAILNFAATGAVSGVDTAIRTGNVYSFRDGRITVHDAYYEVDEALKVVGAEE